MPSEPRIVTEVILTDTDTISVSEEVLGLRKFRVSYHYLIDEKHLSNYCHRFPDDTGLVLLIYSLEQTYSRIGARTLLRI